MIALVISVSLLFFLGMAIGSFLNVIIYRTVNNDSPLRGRSYCDVCKRQIAWYDNIPVISYIVLRRRCRYCHSPIPWSYPAVEVLTGVLFVWWYLIGFTFFQLSARPLVVIQPFFWLSTGIILVVICFTDLLYSIIPDSAVVLLSVFTFFYRLLLTSQHIMRVQDFWFFLASALVASLFFLTLVLITKGKGMGMGDVKLAFPLGLILGWPNILVAVFFAFISGACVGILTILLKKKKLQSAIPFGPFLIFGTLIALVWGNAIVSFYTKLL